MNEVQKIQERYKRRNDINEESLYSFLNPEVYFSQQEKERALIRWIKYSKLLPISEVKLLEVGCGSGGNLLQFIKIGFSPENLVGNELLEERCKHARHYLPEAVSLILGDASNLDLKESSFDVVLQSTVFTSILDYEFQQKLAKHMWSLVKPGGGVLWYDFVYNNPNNSDVRGVSVSNIQKLFPDGKIKTWRLTLAPPISRRVTKLHPSMYSICNLIPLLRTHVLCWIQKTN
ncbi:MULTISPECIES: class I SAM-dependent methyltransferase [unclassified Paenibacillus]|uniref:class I SAM-dependent methyltransferase n=1 Tax=unclassified Paenibacillus TaxID=185978 RepID=UPI003640F8F2